MNILTVLRKATKSHQYIWAMLTNPVNINETENFAFIPPPVQVCSDHCPKFQHHYCISQQCTAHPPGRPRPQVHQECSNALDPDHSLLNPQEYLGATECTPVWPQTSFSNNWSWRHCILVAPPHCSSCTSSGMPTMPRPPQRTPVTSMQLQHTPIIAKRAPQLPTPTDLAKQPSTNTPVYFSNTPTYPSMLQ